MRTSFALVHHANQYLITTGYDNREGIEAIVGADGQPSGFKHILRLHERYRIPFNLHMSGTLLEAIAWHVPGFLDELKRVLATGLVELVGSCYGQNIMRFFGSDYNRRQLNEELLLYRLHLGIDPLTVKCFWPPERVWETRRMAPVLRDARLLNDGYRYVILDDRLLLDPNDPLNPRRRYDETGAWDPDLFRMHEIEDGLGLVAFPIGTRLRRSIPPQAEDDWRQVQSDLEGLLVHAAEQPDDQLLAMYADDMEKVAGIGEWGEGGPARYEAFLEWLSANSQWVNAVKLTEWASRTTVSNKRRVERGTFQELAVEFEAGEGYERWYLASDWAPYRGYFTFADSKVKEAIAAGGDRALLELADKQLLVANWETAWHTPASGPHGDADVHGHASPWARALTSHSRHAAVTAAAAVWMKQRDGRAHAALVDIDGDNEMEIVIKNDKLFGVFTPRWGGRLVALFSVSGDRGAMVVGNPCDDWNWMEELNKYMDVPRNHPGAFADVGFEHEPFAAQIVAAEGEAVRVRFTAECGVVKEVELAADSPSLRMQYELPPDCAELETEIGLSPDYLRLLRSGASCVQGVDEGDVRGCRTEDIFVWVRLVEPERVRWSQPYQPRFGHGYALRASGQGPQFSIDLGVQTGASHRSPAPLRKEPALV
jgi:starch synthase